MPKVPRIGWRARIVLEVLELAGAAADLELPSWTTAIPAES
jgi:hypothetical protein